MPRVAFIWHSAVIPAYRKLLEEVYAVSGAELHLIVPSRWPEAGCDHSAPAGPQTGYWTHVLRTWFIGRHYLYFMPALARTLRAILPDLIYCYAGPYWVITFWTLWIVRRYLPATRVVFVSDQTLFKQYPLPFCWMEEWVLRHADFATSCDVEGIRRLGQKGFPEERAEPVPLGFDAGMFFAEGEALVGEGPALRQGRGSDRAEREEAEPFRILYAGRLLAMKGLTDLIDACARLGVNYELDIAGDGPERAAYQKRAKGLGVAARFRGAVPSETVAGLMRQSDVLVLPSRTIEGKWKEQFGRVLVEAMACGCVPVGSDSGAIPAVIGPAGITFPEGDVAALAKCLSDLAENPGRLRDFRTRALKRARERYSWNAVARLLWSTIERALALPERC